MATATTQAGAPGGAGSYWPASFCSFFLSLSSFRKLILHLLSSLTLLHNIVSQQRSIIEEDRTNACLLAASTPVVVVVAAYNHTTAPVGLRGNITKEHPIPDMVGTPTTILLRRIARRSRTNIQATRSTPMRDIMANRAGLSCSRRRTRTTLREGARTCIVRRPGHHQTRRWDIKEGKGFGCGR